MDNCHLSNIRKKQINKINKINPSLFCGKKSFIKNLKVDKVSKKERKKSSKSFLSK